MKILAYQKIDLPDISTCIESAQVKIEFVGGKGSEKQFNDSAREIESKFSEVVDDISDRLLRKNIYMTSFSLGEDIDVDYKISNDPVLEIKPCAAAKIILLTKLS